MRKLEHLTDTELRECYQAHIRFALEAPLKGLDLLPYAIHIGECVIEASVRGVDIGRK
jgi:hypothetical protein